MSDYTRKFKGVWIPADVWLHRGMSITEKVMLVEIDSLQSADRGCYASNAHFAKFFGLSASRVSEIITSLAMKGMVTVELIRDGKRVVERRVRMNQVFEKPNTYSENAANPIRKTEEGYSEKAEGSNTQSSNTEKQEQGAAAPAASRKPRFDPLNAKPDNVSAEAWSDWCQYRREIRKPLTAKMCEQQGKALAGHPAPDEVLRQSIGNGWTGIFPEKVIGKSNVTPISRHHGFADRDYTTGLKDNGDGTYGF